MSMSLGQQQCMVNIVPCGHTGSFSSELERLFMPQSPQFLTKKVAETESKDGHKRASKMSCGVRMDWQSIPKMDCRQLDLWD